MNFDLCYILGLPKRLHCKHQNLTSTDFQALITVSAKTRSWMCKPHIQSFFPLYYSRANQIGSNYFRSVFQVFRIETNAAKINGKKINSVQ